MSNLIELKIMDMTQDGLGVAKLDGLTIFVPFAVEGETVLVSNIEKQKNYATATLEKILVASPRRAVAPCPHFGKCGGCQLMHLNYETQTLFKQLSLVQTLKRAGISAPVSATKGSLEYEFRNSAQLKVKYVDNDVKIGFFCKHSHNLIDVKNCMVCGPWFFTARQILHDFLKNTIPKNKVENIYISSFMQNDEQNIQINLQTQTGEIFNSERLLEMLNEEFKKVSIWASKQEKESTLLNYKTLNHICGEKYLQFEFLDQTVSLQPNDFFQINTAQAQKLFTYLKNQIDIIKPDVLVDLFCGIGIFSTAVAKYCKNVFAIDINKNAIEKAKKRAKTLKINNVHFMAGDCNKLVFDLEKLLGNKTIANNKTNNYIANLDSLVLNNSNNSELFSQLLNSSTPQKKVLFLDPSRVGAGKNVLDFINKADFTDVYYLSCNPHSLVKDLNRLSEFYRIEEITPYDMFPQTNKIEALVHLKRTTPDFEIKIQTPKLAMVKH